MSIPLISTEELRRKLAFAQDPDRTPGEAETAEMKQAAYRLGSIMAHLFGDSLDRLTLWDRIASGFASACAKVDDGDLDRFVSLCLDHIKADAGKAAATQSLGHMLETFASRPIEWRKAFLRYIKTHSYAVLVHARARWEQVKGKEVEL